MIEILKIEQGTGINYKVTFSQGNSVPETIEVSWLIGRLLFAAQVKGRNEIRHNLHQLLQPERRL